MGRGKGTPIMTKRNLISKIKKCATTSSLANSHSCKRVLVYVTQTIKLVQNFICLPANLQEVGGVTVHSEIRNAYQELPDVKKCI